MFAFVDIRDLLGAIVACGYIGLGRWIVKGRLPGGDAPFALLNLGVLLYFSWGGRARPSFLIHDVAVTLLYVAIVSAQYLAMRYWSKRSGWWPWLAFLIPIAFLATVRYGPLILRMAGRSRANPGFSFVGLSYLAFRTSFLVLEVRNEVVPRPGFWRYLGFTFFAPTLSVGPISRYSQHVRAFGKEGPLDIPIDRALLRVLVGGVKLRFLGPLLNQLTYSGLLLDGHPHPWVDLPIAAVAYYLYLYCNFSGYCDIAIGGAALLGIPVDENFNNPLAARNLQDFWNRWHITLSHYMRDVLFSPLSKALVRLLGPAWINLAMASSIFLVFLLVGIWHGVGWNFVALGAAHGLGLVTVHYFTIGLKRRLDKKQFAAYEANPVIRALAVTLTFAYVSATLFLAANDVNSMKTIFAALRTR